MYGNYRFFALQLFPCMEEKSTQLWTPYFIYAWLAYFFMAFSFYLLTAVLPFYLLKRFAAGETMIGVVMSTYIVAALLTRPYSGFLVDSFSRKPVYLLSYFFFITLFAGYMIAGSILLLLLLRFLHGISWGLTATAGNTLAIDIMPPSRRGEGLGVFGLSNNLAMAIGPMVGLFLYEQFNLNWAFFVALVTGILGFITVILIKVPVKPKVVHDKALSLDRFILVKGIPIGINLILIAVSWGMLLSFAALYGTRMGVKGAGVFFTLMAVGIGASRIIAGRHVDRGRIHHMSLAGTLILGISFTVFALFPVPVIYLCSAFAIGVGFGIIFPSYQNIFINLAPHNQRGTANATYLSSFDIGVGLGMLISGWAAEAISLSAAFLIGAGFVLIAFLLYARISRPFYDKNKLE